MGAAHEAAAAGRSDHDPDLRGGAAAIPARRARALAVTTAPAGAPQAACRNLFRSAALPLRSARGAGDGYRKVSVCGDNAAADGDVPLVGFAERVAAPDPRS